MDDISENTLGKTNVNQFSDQEFLEYVDERLRYLHSRNEVSINLGLSAYDEIRQIKNSLPPKIGEEIANLWNEYDERSTREAKFVKALDKLETLTHLIETGYKTYDRPELIANYADKTVKDFPELTDMLKIIKRKLKSEFKKGNIPWKEEYEHLN